MGQFIRIWKNRITGEFSESRLDNESIPLKLVYDSETRIVYIKFSEMIQVKSHYNIKSFDTKVGYMSPYINENGKQCRFVDNKFIEL